MPWACSFSSASHLSPVGAIGTNLGGCLMGFASPVSIMCSTRWVWPKSYLSLEKTSSCFCKRLWTCTCYTLLLPFMLSSYKDFRWSGSGTGGAWIVVFLVIDFLWNFAWCLDMWVLPFSPPVSCRVTLLTAESLPTSFGFSCSAMVCCTLTASTCPTTESCLITIGLPCGLNMCTGIVVELAASTTVGPTGNHIPLEG